MRSLDKSFQKQPSNFHVAGAQHHLVLASIARSIASIRENLEASRRHLSCCRTAQGCKACALNPHYFEEKPLCSRRARYKAIDNVLIKLALSLITVPNSHSQPDAAETRQYRHQFQNLEAAQSVPRVESTHLQTRPGRHKAQHGHLPLRDGHTLESEDLLPELCRRAAAGKRPGLWAEVGQHHLTAGSKPKPLKALYHLQGCSKRSTAASSISTPNWPKARSQSKTTLKHVFDQE